MAKLIAVQKSDTVFTRRQIPLEESDIKMVVQFEKCGDCEGQVKQKEMDKFLAKCQALTKDELAVSLLAPCKDIFTTLSQCITCVGCRRSVENLFLELKSCGYPTLEPLIVTAHSELSIRADICEPRSLFCLFYIHGPKHSCVLDNMNKGKSKKRCNLHSLDMHKVKTPSSWCEVWDLMSKDCQNAVLTISCSKFEETLSSYLTKHRFCTECRAKVMLAYNILTGQHPAEEKGYCKRMFEALQHCKKEGHRHLHIKKDNIYQYISELIAMAEPELTGTNRRDRHAKTLDIAQEEVLTCLGIHIYERLHKIGQRLKQEEQTWRLLFFLGVETLRKSFECAVERKQGVSNLQRLCAEFEAEEQLKQQRKELKRQKKKRKKAMAKSERENLAQQIDQEVGHCECSSSSIVTKPLQTSHLAQCDNHSMHCQPSLSNNNNNSLIAGCNHSLPQHSHHHHQQQAQASQSVVCTDGDVSPCVAEHSCGVSHASLCRNSDCGYSSELDGCDNCSCPSSNDGSDICSDGMCLHEGETGELTCSDCRSAGGSPERTFAGLNGVLTRRGPPQAVNPHHACQSPHSPHMVSLADMLQKGLSCDEDEDSDGEGGISEEDIRNFQANRMALEQERAALRQNLKQRFENMRQQRGVSPGSSPCSSPAASPCLSARFRHQ